MILAKRTKAVKPSPTLSLNAKAKALAAKGADVVSFAAGEPDFDTPEHIKAAAKLALDQGFTRYTPTGGIPELKAAIAETTKKELGLAQVTPEQVLVSCGAKHTLYNLFQALLSPGDEVVIFSPYWVSYPDMVRLADGEPVIVETSAQDGWVPDAQALRRALTPKTKAVVLNSPSNPTGAVLDPTAIKKLAEVLKGHDCLIITDDIYAKLLYTGGTFANIVTAAPELAARTVVVNGVSKAYAMTGWRIGWAVGPKELVSAMQLVQDQSTSNPTSIAQKAALAAITGPQDSVEMMRKEFHARRDLIVKGLNAIPGIRCREPEGAFYVFPNVEELIGKRHQGAPITGSVKLSEALLEQFLLAAVPGEPFGAEGYLRLSFAASRETIEKGLERMRKLVDSLS